MADKPYNLFNKGEEVTIKGEAYVSPRLVGKNYVFIYDVYDYYGNRTNTYNHKLKASNSHLEDQLRIVLDKYGMMRVDVRIKDNANVVGGTAETAFGVLINVRNRQKYMQDAVFGMQASPNKATAELCQKIGVKWFRKMDFDYSPLFWDNVEKEKGKFNWEGIDETIDYMLDKKMLVTVPLTTTPKWARRNPDSRFSFPKDTNDYGNFVRAVVTRYKDKIKHWEIWNEPMN
ncbi:MAG: endo-1,4-beta-xylanase, partial [Candidatus Omnitrophica bacterium]|nr:endo-1,4-beta-xylanase [Candidatus Omnitrophota bacterium]